MNISTTKKELQSAFSKLTKTAQIKSQNPLVNYTNSVHPFKSKKAEIYTKSNLRFYKKHYSSMTFNSHLINIKKLIMGRIFSFLKGF